MVMSSSTTPAAAHQAASFGSHCRGHAWGNPPDALPTPTADQFKTLLNRVEAATFLGVSRQTLAAWASNKRVILPFVKMGRRVMYRRQDLDAFCASNLVGATATTEVRQ